MAYNLKDIYIDYQNEYNDNIDGLLETNNQFSIQLQEAEKEFNDLEDAAERIRIERNKLQIQVAVNTKDLDVVENEVSKVPVLETAVEFEKKKVQVLEQKILDIQQTPINTQQQDIVTLQRMNDKLKSKIATMTRLSDFNIDDAQQLVEAKTQIVDLTKKLERLKNGNQ